MEKKYADIINEGKTNGESIEAINAKLKEAGANFHLDENGAVVGWSEAEMAEGFKAPEQEAEPVKRLHDYMRYNPANAGKTIRVSVPEGTYDVTWNDNGNPVKAVRV